MAPNNSITALLLQNGHILICDENNNRAIEVTRDGKIVWQYGSGDPTINEPVSGVAFASRLPKGHTLVTDSSNSRIVLLTSTQRRLLTKFLHPGDAPVTPRFFKVLVCVRS